jgi:uncharacterized protein DUF6431
LISIVVHQNNNATTGSAMVHIVAGILSLIQYLKTLEDKPEQLRPSCCPCCGKLGLWLHGCYPRKADRSGKSEESLNPIFIQRFFCPDCRGTSSTLPECIPPRRWYLWEVQQIALIGLLLGKRAYAIAKEIIPSRHTISRWATRLKDQYYLHKDILCGHFMALGRASGFSNFWETCLNKIPLSQAMRLCHVAGVAIP